LVAALSVVATVGTFAAGCLVGFGSAAASHVFTRMRERGKDQREVAGHLQELLDRWADENYVPVFDEIEAAALTREFDRYLSRLRDRRLAEKVRDVIQRSSKPLYGYEVEQKKEYYAEIASTIKACQVELGAYYQR
jgi:hypothetical protein